MKKKLTTRDRSSAPVVLPVIIAEWPRNSTEVIRLTFERYRGLRRADLRIWFLDDSGELRRTRRGVPIPLEDLVSIRNGLRKADEAAVELGLVGLPAAKPRRVRSNWVVDLAVKKSKQ
jgi:hypothetical protein